IKGRGGVSINDAWAEGAGTLHGMTARGFPNLFNIHLLQSGIAINFAHLLSELAVHAAWIAAHCLNAGIVEIEPTAEAQEAWFYTLLGTLGTQPQFFAECTPAYQNAEGKMEMTPAAVRSIPYFGPTLDFLKILEDWRDEAALGGMDVRKQV
ncbi:MAG: monooxygenase, partial [Sphingorhabdus sp.]|nr:monooxygenase [Sphingorhabdus sp.]